VTRTDPDVPAIVARDAGPDAAVAEQARRLGSDALAVRMLRARGVSDDDALRRTLAPKLRDLRPPEAMAGFPAALDLLAWAERRRIRVGVFGDYDVDGVCTAAILAGYLQAAGVGVVTRVAHRDAGYGLSEADADAFAASGVGLVLVGDTGTSDIEALARIRSRGMRSIVIDHHQVPSEIPPTDALINPHQPACGFPFKGLCSAGVAFYLCASLRTQLAGRGHARPPDPKQWLDLVAIATICDMMPLVDENRVLVHRGLASLRTAPRPGVRALLERAGAWGENPPDEHTVGFKIGPRLNSPGRLGAADPALRLLCARTAAEAAPVAEQIDGLNAQRRALSERAVGEASIRLAADAIARERGAICVWDPTWAPGVVGLVAGNLAERFARPAMALAVDVAAGVARGSVRSHGGVDVRAALQACESLLLRFGGHREAAGLTVAIDKLDAVAEAFANACGAAPASAPPTVIVDGRVDIADADVPFARRIAELGPYGVGFAAPVFGLAGRVVSTRVLKDRHLSLRLGDGSATIDAIAFGLAEPGRWVPAVGDDVELLGRVSLDVFRGQARTRLLVERLWPSRGALVGVPRLRAEPMSRAV
jgi:single-stranded-DNA-specific exonuclease